MQRWLAAGALFVCVVVLVAPLIDVLGKFAAGFICGALVMYGLFWIEGR